MGIQGKAQTIEAVLPKHFEPVGCSRLVRIGRNGDGGYLVCEENASDTDVLLSFGVSDDWSFEEAFQARSGAIVHAFDGSVSARFFVGRVLRNLLTLRLPSFARNAAMTLAFWRYFSQSGNFYSIYVGDESDERTISLSDAVDRYGGERTTLKMDIEGAEIRLFDQILAAKEMLSALVIEIHDFDLHLERVLQFTKELGLKLIHIHANNYAKVSRGGIPRVVELTFSKSCDHGCEVTLPSHLDQPNNPAVPEIRIAFQISE